MPGATGSGKGFSEWALGFVLVELAIILSALSPKLERVGGGAGGSWREKGGNLPLVVWVRFLEGLLKSDRC